ncbi:b kinase gamma catalytic chain, skeletal muscle heart isoform-like isoform X2 [Octopus vulgaris]|uniref:B kinase gamma catalytic chain, skeletal muscle heart isoform-like isoform X2 n=2 Tax=Octopus TaxID=6643 RepID=A0AA36F4S6_OCTVU|nr:phosphorylase b kinase gamma catalytic chain, skeletal muscle/heart isoform [Octopus sinensis]XP_029638221.1 phosphorylase b kinase gamma catalytic chain, skeletal muscle/heart isoform [Octopus sinensis]CAI9723980.1 b kinase gamma catalytic chain, skeletal muscle heart isoform-like isoform X2 [Octopus vulgaris]
MVGMTKEEDVLPSSGEAKDFYAKYEPKELLGRGVTSVVRLCVEKETQAEYAVKIIDVSGENCNDNYPVEQARQDTMREIKILNLCANHKYIINLHDVFETSTFIFLVFELCKKGELFDYLTQVVTLSEKRTRIIIRQLLEAVDFVHEKSIVHRDLKPENILLDDDMNVKLTDFGLATILTDNQELTELCGTPGYLAPEVLQVSMNELAPGYREEVDMWAVGVIMYTLLSGSPPFWHRKQIYMLRSIMEGNYQFNSTEWNDVGNLPKDLISKLLVVDPKKRLTAKEALQHPFLNRDLGTEKKLFNAVKKFRAGIICIRFFFRLQYFYQHPQNVSVETLLKNPYQLKTIRKIIDGCAFKVYGHWVKRGENQNRAALFEHCLRDDWKTSDTWRSSELTR